MRSEEIERKEKLEQRIRDYIKQDGRSLSNIAQKLGQNRDTFHKWVTGVNGIPKWAIRELCAELQLNRQQTEELYDLAGYAITPVLSPTHEESQPIPHVSSNQDNKQLQKLFNRPKNYIPIPRNTLFQVRPNEFERLEIMLFDPDKKTKRLGLIGVVGMGGVGKTQLAVEIAYRYIERFPDGIFWMTASGTSLLEWQQQMAELAVQTNYLSSEDDPSRSENEIRRARYMSDYLAKHEKALLILDNVEDPSLIISALPALAGSELACTIIYTSRVRAVPDHISIYDVERLPIEGALCLVLESTRPELLVEVQTGSQSAEAKAALRLCQYVDCLPLALVHLRGLLAKDPHLKLTRLDEEVKQRGMLEVAKKRYFDVASLFATFWLSWEKVEDKAARQLFKLAAYFPEATPIPLWLLGLAAGLGEDSSILDPLGEALMLLRDLSLMEELAAGQVRLHPLIREFAQRLVLEEGDVGYVLKEEAGNRLAAEFANWCKLEQRARKEGYWKCLAQLREAQSYIILLGIDKRDELEQTAHLLDRESHLLGDDKLWPNTIPGLFYQQLYNRSIEEGLSITNDKTPEPWLRQLNQVGTEEVSLIRIFSGHADDVSKVAFSPDGTKILTGSSDGTARLWETSSGKLLVTFQADSQFVITVAVAFSPDGTKILTASSDASADGEIKLWEANSGKLLRTFRSSGHGASGIAFSPDGAKVLVGTSDKVRLWNVRSGKLVATFEGHSSFVTSVAFSPDGTKILTGSDDDTARLWEAKSGRLIWDIQSPYYKEDTINSVAFSPDGLKLLMVSDLEMVWMWDISSRELVATFNGRMQGWGDACFSPDGTRVLAVYDQQACLWGITSNKIITTFQTHAGAVRSVAFSPDGTKILTGSDDSTARLWEIAKGKPFEPERGHDTDITSVAFSPDGTRVLTGSHDNTAKLWGANHGKLLITFKGHKASLSSVAFSPDGTRVLTGSHDNTAKLWDANHGKLLATLKGGKSSITSVVFSPDGTKILTCLMNGVAYLWAVSSQKCISTFPHKTSVDSAAFSSDGTKALMGTWDGKTYLWDVIKKRLLITFEGQVGWVRDIAVSPDSTKILTCSNEGMAILWDAIGGKPLVTMENGTGYLTKGTFSPNGQLVLTCNRYGHVCIWRATEPEIGRLLGIYAATYKVMAVYWQSNEKILLADDGGSLARPFFYQIKLEGFNL